MKGGRSLNSIEIFRNERFGEVGASLINGVGWLVGMDVAEALGYANTKDALARHVDEEDKSEVVIYNGSQNRKMVVINENGLYSLVLSSKLPSAKLFRRWVTEDVLPCIRKNGLYATAYTFENMPTQMGQIYFINKLQVGLLS